MEMCAHTKMHSLMKNRNPLLSALILVFLLASLILLEPVGTLISAEVEASDSTGGTFAKDSMSSLAISVDLNETDYVLGELSVHFYEDVTHETISETIVRLGTEIEMNMTQFGMDLTGEYWSEIVEMGFNLSKFFSLRIVSNRTVWETVHLFENEPTVEFAEPNFIDEPGIWLPSQHQLYPNDPEFPNQWGLLNAGQVTVASGVGGIDVMAGDSDVCHNLTLFVPNQTHTEFIPANGIYDPGESIYLDNDASGSVTVGDRRLTYKTAGRPRVTYPPGSVVGAGDIDIDLRLAAFAPDESHDERVLANGVYDHGEWIYRDNNLDGHVSAGDERLSRSGGTIDADIDMPQAWSLIDAGELWRNGNPVVAVIDTGVDLDHRDLNGNLVSGYNSVNPALPPRDDGPLESRGHGTHVSGIIGAVGDNSFDIAGVNWHAWIMPLRTDFSHRRFARCMAYALLMKILWQITEGAQGQNVRVINYSAGGRSYVETSARWIALAGAFDILFVTSAGNSARDNDVGEYIYRDIGAGNVGNIGPGDVRLTRVTAFHPGPADPPHKDATRTYAAGTIVAAGDWDAIAATPLIDFTLWAQFWDANGDGAYDLGEPIYRDYDTNGVVSIGPNPSPDFRKTSVTVGAVVYPAGSRVRNGDGDVGRALSIFIPNERHVDDRHVDGRPEVVDRRHRREWYEGPAQYPSNYPLDNIIAVAASNHLDNMADFSNYGRTSVDLAAPGEDILSLAITAPGQPTVTVKSGTSMAAPHVSGVASLAFAMFPERTALQVKQDILRGTEGNLYPCMVPEQMRIPPASGVDRRPPFGAEAGGGYHPILVSDGRLRFPYTGDLGDAPHDKPKGGSEEYDTIACIGGALHWDTGNEWFGFPAACSNEVGALWPYPRDEDIFKNPNLPCMTFSDNDDFDHPQPPNFYFVPEPPWVPGQLVTVFYYISTNYLGVNDAEGGRYQSTPNRMIYVNGFFDWNWNGKFDPEHTVHQPHDLSALAAPGSRSARSPPRTSVLLFTSTFIAKGSIPRWIRFRLDYGEDVSSVYPNPPIPDPPVTDPAWGLPGFLPDPVFPVWEHRKRARFGEVEDWPLCLKYPFWPWTMFGCDLTRASYSVSAGPCTNNVLWTYKTGGAIYSSPAVAEGKVYVGSSDNNVYALDAETGTLLWNYTTECMVDSSPAVFDNRVFVGSWDGDIYALDADSGELLWKYTTGDAIVCSPAVANGKVFVGSSDGNFYALDAETGNRVWRYVVGDWIDSSPAVVDGKVFFGSWDGFVYALNAETGTRVWRYNTGDVIVSSPAVVDGKLYIGSMNGKIYCLDAESGSLEWSYTTVGPIKGSPAVTCGKVFIGSYDGNVYALNAETGGLVWKAIIDAPLYSSPAVACKRKVFIASLSEDHGMVYSLDAETGTILWTYETEGQIQSSPAVANSTLFIGSSDGKLYAFRSLHDVSITNIVPLNTIVGQGSMAKINATVKNKGDFDETFDIIVCTNLTVVQTLSATLDKGSSATMTLTWDTTGYSKGNYVMDVHIVPVPYEYESMKDNSYYGVTIEITIAGDLNADGAVDIRDITIVAMAFGSKPGDDNWNAVADLNDDEVIDIRDITIVALEFGKTV